ncbi:pyroglutamyl-peptidase 1 [Xylocopa sonorina]|uniref:pyroglutamyl-peptidase 1 n=1 Tax=Xylocopa sonorina TaxID=1818115 RepID=UPI00403A9C11
MEVKKKNVILVTGFGQFDNHIINASWEAVKELSKLCHDSEEMSDVRVVIKEIPVSYDDVSTYVPRLWREYNPIILLHVGVSGQAQCLTIEGCAHSNGYLRPDIYEKRPDETNIEFDVLKTKINVQQICDAINGNTSKTKCNACISYDAGRYLCEYIYYKSLQIASKRTLFVHVPDFDRYSSVQTAKGLYDILRYILRDVKKCEQ